MEIEQTNKYQALLVIVLGFSIIALIFDWKYLLYGVIGIGVLSIMFSSFGDLVVKLWFKLAQALGWVNARVLLSIIFFLFLFPISLIYRLFSKDDMMLKKEYTSTFKTRNHKYVKEDLENIW